MKNNLKHLPKFHKIDVQRPDTVVTISYLLEVMSPEFELVFQDWFPSKLEAFHLYCERFLGYSYTLTKRTYVSLKSF